MLRTVLNIAAVVAVVAGIRWVLVGANIIAGSAMSGMGQWLAIGIGCTAIGLVLGWWANFRRAA
ncbi:hypothetical protein [Devosia sp.]|uniref:hypothetical protein n=1 Tax=Devosia sp. TaxID=1871048 RepID=UPI002FC96136